MNSFGMFAQKLPIVILAVQKDHYKMFAQNEQLSCLLQKIDQLQYVLPKMDKDNVWWPK